MNYFFDCEFHEGFSKSLFARKRHFIDLISIGIVAEDGRKYYAINKNFDLKAAWNSYQMDKVYGDMRNAFPDGIRNYWLRDNVLKPIFKELWYEKCHMQNLHHVTNDFTYSNFKRLINIYGKSITDLRYEIFSFFFPLAAGDWIGSIGELWNAEKTETVDLYGYYSAYDHVVLCSIFGKMINLPNGVPMYTKDLKQMMDERGLDKEWKRTFCPDPKGEHNALVDAEWNMELFEKVNNYSKVYSIA